MQTAFVTHAALAKQVCVRVKRLFTLQWFRFLPVDALRTRRRQLLDLAVPGGGGCSMGMSWGLQAGSWGQAKGASYRNGMKLLRDVIFLVIRWTERKKLNFKWCFSLKISIKIANIVND